MGAFSSADPESYNAYLRLTVENPDMGIPTNELIHTALSSAIDVLVDDFKTKVHLSRPDELFITCGVWVEPALVIEKELHGKELVRELQSLNISLSKELFDMGLPPTYAVGSHYYQSSLIGAAVCILLYKKRVNTTDAQTVIIGMIEHRFSKTMETAGKTRVTCRHPYVNSRRGIASIELTPELYSDAAKKIQGRMREKGLAVIVTYDFANQMFICQSIASAR